MSERSVIVVGTGVVGAACAHYLREANWHVTMVDRAGFGQGCSHGNCGYVCPSHVLPLATPGAIGPAMRALISRNSPFRIKPRFNPALWGWLFRFARRCNTRQMMESAQAIHALLTSSRQLYDQLIAQERFDCEWETRGLLFVFQNAGPMNHYAEVDHLLRDKFGVGAERLDGDALIQLDPALKPGLAGGWWYRGDAHLRPDRLMSAWRQLLLTRGVQIRENCEVTGLLREGQSIRAVQTSQGDLHADAVVLATGAWTPLLNRWLGFKAPIQPGKGYSITMPRPTLCPTYPMIFEEHRVAITPMPSGYRIGSTMEFAGYDTTLNPQRLQLLREGAALYLREPLSEPEQEHWYGWRPMTYDSKPIIGRSPTADNLLIAAGHSMLGLSMAPATGRLVAELLSGTTPHVDPLPYAPHRFV